nr:hypothetical protein [Pseudopedobacter sp.]
MGKSTVVEMLCVSKKEGIQWGQKGNPTEWEIELQVPYNQDSVFYKQSGGTNQLLKTINASAAELFEIGETYVMTLSKKVEDTMLAA